MRKEYDDLADKITSNRLLRPREDQHANLAKLNAEIADLQVESQEYAQTWSERRQQFGRIIEEGMQLRRLIRDEKEEVERREGMMEEEQRGEDVGDEDHLRERGRSSGVETPRQDHETGGTTTPMHMHMHHGTAGLEQEVVVGTPGGGGGLAVERGDPLGGGGRRGKSPLRLSSQNAVVVGEEKLNNNNNNNNVPSGEDDEDEEMAEDGELLAAAEPEAEHVVAAPVAGVIADDDNDGKEQGDDSSSSDGQKERQQTEQMDTS